MEKRKVKKWTDNKTLIKIVSFALAITLWLYVAVTQDPTRTDRVDRVEVMCGLSQNQINQGLQIISKSHDFISFEATGKRSLVTGVRGTYYAKLDLENITAPGKYSITPEISRPDGVYVNGVTPSVVEVYVDRYVSSTLPVTIETKGAIKDNLIIADMKTDVSHIDVQLPSLALEQISSVGVVVDLSDINASTTISYETVLFDSEKNVIDIKNVIIDKKSLVIDINVEQVKNVKILPNVTNMDKFAAGYNITVMPKNIDICGDKNILNAITSIETDTITLNKKVENGQEITAKLNLPEGTRINGNTGDKVKLIFNKK